MEALPNIPTFRPPPTDFDTFLPWACGQMSVGCEVVITRTVQSEYVSVAGRKRTRPIFRPKKMTVIASPDTVTLDEELVSSSVTDPHHISKLHIESIYDGNLKLVKLKFLKNNKIPRTLLKIIGLMTPFHESLTSITINSGLCMEAIYDISTFLHLSQITELNFDRTFLVEANYHVLLGQNSLKHLSLAKCNITDAVVETIACKLSEPCPAAKTLSLLNLATNRITDSGAKCLAVALRTNRKLSYLNLADNAITDTGAADLLNSLVDFCLTSQEWKERSERYMIYVKNKIELVHKVVKEICDGNFDKKYKHQKSGKSPVTPPPKKNKPVEKDTSVKVIGNRSLINVKAIYHDRAEAIVKEKFGLFQHPFSSHNTQSRDGEVYCFGNNILCYLNLAYNNLTYFSIKKLHEVLRRQKILGRNPTGLINVIIDGNYLPEVCEELLEIDDLLDSGLLSTGKMVSSDKKSRISGFHHK